MQHLMEWITGRTFGRFQLNRVRSESEVTATKERAAPNGGAEKGVIRDGKKTRSFFRFLSDDLAIDLGTANTVVFARESGILLDEPSFVAINRNTRSIEAYGHNAKRMLGRTPQDLTVVQPLKDGVIADFETTEAMLKHFIKKVRHNRSLLSSRIVICVPSRTTEVERRAVRDAAQRLGASSVFVVLEPIAAAVGSGLPVHEPGGNMIVDIGGGTTEIAVISLSGIVCSSSVRSAGNHMDEAIIDYVRRKYNLLIGERTAEEIKMRIGSALQLEARETMVIRGRSMLEGIPRSFTVTDEEIREALSDSVSSIVNTIRIALEQTPPELSGDIIERGIHLCGGGSLLRRIDELIALEIGVPVHPTQQPLLSVALGTGRLLRDVNFLRRTSL